MLEAASKAAAKLAEDQESNKLATERQTKLSEDLAAQMTALKSQKEDLLKCHEETGTKIQNTLDQSITKQLKTIEQKINQTSSGTTDSLKDIKFKFGTLEDALEEGSKQSANNQTSIKKAIEDAKDSLETAVENVSIEQAAKLEA